MVESKVKKVGRRLKLTKAGKPKLPAKLKRSPFPKGKSPKQLDRKIKHLEVEFAEKHKKVDMRFKRRLAPLERETSANTRREDKYSKAAAKWYKSRGLPIPSHSPWMEAKKKRSAKIAALKKRAGAY